MSGGTIFLILLGLLIVIPIIGCITWVLYEEHRYRTKGSNQKLMFNELSKGDYIWSVTSNGITYYTVDKVLYFFDNNQHHDITRMKIYYGEWDYIELQASAAKSYKQGKWHTNKKAAELEYKRIQEARNEGISNFKGATSQEIKKAQDELIKQLNKIS